MKLSSVCRSRAILASAAVAALAGTINRAEGAEISVNFDQSGTTGVVDSAGAAGTSAAAQQGDWNNLTISYTTSTSYGDSTGLSANSLIDNSGSNTQLTLTASDADAGQSFQDTTQSGVAGTAEDRELFTVMNYGLIDTTFNYKDGLSLVLAHNPYAKYDVYVYVEASVTGDTASVSDGTTKYYFQTGSETFGGYTAITSTLSSAPTTGNYVEFANETATTLTLNMNSALTATYVGVGALGLQIVQVVPEPSALFLSGIGAAALLLRRKSRAKPMSV